LNVRHVVHRLLRLLPFLAGLLLAGCGGQLPWQSAAAPDPAAEDDAKCQSRGYHPGTPDYEKCRMRVADERSAAETQDRSDLAGRLQGKPPSWWNPGPNSPR
jgi:hypothetical protein